MVLFFSKEKRGEKRKRYGEGEERGERGREITPPPFRPNIAARTARPAGRTSGRWPEHRRPDRPWGGPPNIAARGADHVEVRETPLGPFFTPKVKS